MSDVLFCVVGGVNKSVPAAVIIISRYLFPSFKINQTPTISTRINGYTQLTTFEPQYS